MRYPGARVRTLIYHYAVSLITAKIGMASAFWDIPNGNVFNYLTLSGAQTSSLYQSKCTK